LAKSSGHRFSHQRITTSGASDRHSVARTTSIPVPVTAVTALEGVEGPYRVEFPPLESVVPTATDRATSPSGTGDSGDFGRASTNSLTGSGTYGVRSSHQSPVTSGDRGGDRPTVEPMPTITLDSATLREVLGSAATDAHAVACVQFNVISALREIETGIRTRMLSPRRRVCGRLLADWLNLDDVARLLKAGTR
jgi:hypothetical protein